MEKPQYIINAGYSIKSDISDGKTTVGEAFEMLSNQVIKELQTDQNRLSDRKSKLHEELRAVQDQLNFNRRAIEEMKEKFPDKGSIGEV